VLVFIGVKMLLVDIYKIPVAFSLLGTGAILATSVVLSLYIPAKGRPTGAYPFPAKERNSETERP
jgi:tellurite resistance protein TerC